MSRTGTVKNAAAAAPGKAELARWRKRSELILARLEARYGVAEWCPRFGPVDELVACILSQHTSDVNSLRAFDNLRRQYPCWEALLDAPAEAIADTIRSGGMANSKAVRIQDVLRCIVESEGGIALDCLDQMTDEEARAYLMALPGVGPKTAAIVLSFALGRPVIPVDTHIFRVAWRLGLIERKLGEARAHDALQRQVAPELVYRFHVALITHGRQVCKAPRPRCGECPLTDLCRYYREVVSAAGPAATE
jgi:endonuclease III